MMEITENVADKYIKEQKKIGNCYPNLCYNIIYKSTRARGDRAHANAACLFFLYFPFNLLKYHDANMLEINVRMIPC